MRTSLSLLAAILIFGLVGAQGAGQPAQDLLVAADAARGDTEGVTWDLDVTELSKGKTSENALFVKSRGTNFLAEYTKPAEMKGEKLVSHERNMWFMKPGVSKAVPISPRQRLLGAASYGDIASSAYSTHYNAKALADEGDNAVFDLTAKNDKETYDRIKLWVSKNEKVATKADYESKTGKVLKTVTFEYGNKGKDDSSPFVSKMVIKDGDDTTTLTYSDIKFTAVAPSTFRMQ